LLLQPAAGGRRSGLTGGGIHRLRFRFSIFGGRFWWETLSLAGGCARYPDRPKLAPNLGREWVEPDASVQIRRTSARSRLSRPVGRARTRCVGPRCPHSSARTLQLSRCTQGPAAAHPIPRSYLARSTHGFASQPANRQGPDPVPRHATTRARMLHAFMALPCPAGVRSPALSEPPSR
jgi:hypothetical protein